MKYLNYMFIGVVGMSCMACGDRERVNVGEVGMIVGTSGLEDKIIPPSAFRLDPCGTGACPKLVRMETTKQTHKVKVNQVFIAKKGGKKVDLSNVEISVQFRVKPDKLSIKKVFKEIKPTTTPTQTRYLIESKNIWKTYLERIVPEIAIDVIRHYDVESILTKIPEIRKHYFKQLVIATKELPVQITAVSFPNGIGDLPESVTKAYRKLFAIEADKQRKIKALEATLEVEKQRIKVQKVRAENDRKVAKTLGISVVEYMKLKIAERYTDAIADAADNNQPFAVGMMPITNNNNVENKK